MAISSITLHTLIMSFLGSIIYKYMDIFSILLIVLFVATAIYYIVFFSLCYYWHEAKFTFVVVPVIYTFEFFIAGFLIISIISIVVIFLPEILTFIKWQ